MTYTESQEQIWKQYENVRKSGQFNMITEADKATVKAGLTWSQYRFIIGNYAGIREQIIKKYGSVDAFMRADG